jgi:hypothetical protein
VFRKLFLITGAAIIIVGIVLGPPASSQFDSPRSQSQTEKEMQERAAREANKKRQQDIRTDTDKLFQLANELKDAVDKSNEHLLSLEVVRKADEVEKLAHRVKEKMKEAIGPPAHEEPQRLPNPRIP